MGSEKYILLVLDFAKSLQKLSAFFQKYKKPAKFLMFRQDFRTKGGCSKSVTKKLYWNKILIGKCIFKLVCHCESCKQSEIGCA